MKLLLLLPCYNEMEILDSSNTRLQTLAKILRERFAVDTDILYVNDGSKDTTWQIIQTLSQEFPNVLGISLAHNAGHQNALWAGLEYGVEAYDWIVTIDADLQDDENAILDMVAKAKEGADIVYGIRDDRATDTVFKKTTAEGFYRIMRMADKELLYNHADFRLMSRRSIQSLLQYPERNLYLRGIVRTLGFKEDFVYYSRRERLAGESKYPLNKMIALAMEGITSFSTIPLRIITFMAVLFFAIAGIILGFAIYNYAIGNTVPGWTSLLVSIWFIGGCIMLSIDILGLYIGRTYVETKRRPRYFIAETTGKRLD